MKKNSAIINGTIVNRILFPPLIYSDDWVVFYKTLDFIFAVNIPIQDTL